MPLLRHNRYLTMSVRLIVCTLLISVSDFFVTGIRIPLRFLSRYKSGKPLMRRQDVSGLAFGLPESGIVCTNGLPGDAHFLKAIAR